MKRSIRIAVLSCAVSATAIAPMSAAYADDSDILAAGAAILGAIAQPEPRTLLDRDLNDGIDPYESLGFVPAAAAQDDRQAQFVEPTPPDNWDINDRGWFKYCEDMYRWGKSRGGKMTCSVE